LGGSRTSADAFSQALDNESKETYTVDEMVGLILRGAYIGKIDYEIAKKYFVQFCNFSKKWGKVHLVSLYRNRRKHANHFPFVNLE